MARTILNDDTWQQLQSIMTKKGCYSTENNRNVMEAILWKLRTGAPWRDIPERLCPWKTAYNRFNRWSANGLWDNFFLSYEAKLIRNGYPLMEATSALISMQLELGAVKIEQLGEEEAERQQRYTWPLIRMDARSILKSLGVKSTTVKLQTN